MKYIYFIGIGGVGMSALAMIAKEKGNRVAGSDENIYFTDKILNEHKITWYSKFNAGNLKEKPDCIVVSAAYDEKNVEVAEAKRLKITIKPYSQLLGEIMADYRGIAVAGIHGKTTTTAMVACLFERAKLDPSFLVGCREVADLGTNAKLGEGEFFITEADEYKRSAQDLAPKLFDLKPEMIVITNIEMDHPDVYESIEDIYGVFYKFACKVPRNGVIVAGIDSAKVKKLALNLADRKIETYGFSLSAKWRVIDYQAEPGRQVFSLQYEKTIYGPFQLKIPGRYNILNATAAIIISLKAGIRMGTIQKYLPDFVGAERRFQVIGEKNGVTVVDDYAHHPTAVRVTLEAAKEMYPGGRIVCIFQPHTYSRTKELLTEFGSAFEAADKVIICDIYASAREKSGRIHARHLVAEIQKHHRNVMYIGKLKDVVDYIEENLEKRDILMVMGAGDVYKVGEQYLAKDTKESSTVIVKFKSKES